MKVKEIAVVRIANSNLEFHQRKQATGFKTQDEFVRDAIRLRLTWPQGNPLMLRDTTQQYAKLDEQ